MHFSRVYLRFRCRVGCFRKYKEGQVFGDAVSSTNPAALFRLTMLSSSLVTLGLAVIGAYANPTVRAAGGLEVYLSTSSNNIASLSDLRVIAAVKNTGDKDLKILKSGTVLDDEQRGQSFIITKDGKEVPFTGTEVCTTPFPTFRIVDKHQPIGSRLHGLPL